MSVKMHLGAILEMVMSQIEEAAKKLCLARSSGVREGFGCGSDAVTGASGASGTSVRSLAGKSVFGPCLLSPFEPMVCF